MDKYSCFRFESKLCILKSKLYIVNSEIKIKLWNLKGVSCMHVHVFLGTQISTSNMKDSQQMFDTFINTFMNI